eukprot:6932089-Prymnesium_polylepis.1
MALDTLTAFCRYVSGTLPQTLGRLTWLREADVSHNRLSGTLPLEFGLLQHLRSWTIAGSRISGTLPSQIGLTSSLSSLDLRQLPISGSIPSELGLHTFVYLDLCSTFLSGSIPDSVCQAAKPAGEYGSCFPAGTWGCKK